MPPPIRTVLFFSHDIMQNILSPRQVKGPLSCIELYYLQHLELRPI